MNRFRHPALSGIILHFVLQPCTLSCTCVIFFGLCENTAVSCMVINVGSCWLFFTEFRLTARDLLSRYCKFFLIITCFCFSNNRVFCFQITGFLFFQTTALCDCITNHYFVASRDQCLHPL